MKKNLSTQKVVTLFYFLTVLIGCITKKDDPFLFAITPTVALFICIVVVKTIFLVNKAYQAAKIKVEKEEEEIREDIKWWLKGGKPSKTLLEIGYEFTPSIGSNGGAYLNMPEFVDIGGGSKELFRYITFFGSDTLSKKRRLEWVCIIGRLADIPNWYKLSLQERGQILKDRLPADYFERIFEL